MVRFSIVVPAYNAGGTLSETLDAVAAQEFEDWECIVVDDGSTDNTLAIASSYAERDPRFRALSQDNQGSAGAYNTGVAEARGEFVVLCSADDILLKQHLSTLSAFIADNPDYDIYSTNGYYWRSGSAREIVYGRDEVLTSLELVDVIRNCFYSVGAAYRRELFLSLGGYRRDVFGEDYDFWLRAMASGAKHRYLPEPLSLHRVSRGQKSANLERAYESDIRLLTDLRESRELSADERAAVDATIRERQRLIERLGDRSLFGALRRMGASAVGRLVGRSRLRRWLGSHDLNEPHE